MQKSFVEKQNLPGYKQVLELRSRLAAAVREFFRARGYREVETPVIIPTPALELHIDAFPAGNGFLRTSPEFHMKRLLAAGYERIFQLGKCFRAGEIGRFHNPEFTMLEWYRAKADYMDILEETKDLLTFVAQKCLGRTVLNIRIGYSQGRDGQSAAADPPSLDKKVGTDSLSVRPENERRDKAIAPYRLKTDKIATVGSLIQPGQAIDLAAEWRMFSVAELFEKYAGWNPADNFDERRFDDDLVNIVEPRLPKDRPVVLRDYPAEAAAFARLNTSDRRLAERWELYLGGVEIANAFSELTDPVEQKRRFEECAARRREMGKEVYAPDQEFFAALEKGLPPCAGIALGIDRLLMLFAGAESLDEVIPFRDRGQT